jgi:hypothetical protein
MSLIKSIDDAIAAHYDELPYDDFPAAVFAAIEAAGWQLVPKEPTEEMRDAGWDRAWGINFYERDGALVIETTVSRDIYRAMLAAAPKPEMMR